MQDKSISKLLKQASYLHRLNKTTSAHLSINSLLRHPHFSTLCAIAESLEQALKEESSTKLTKASRVVNFRKRVLANEEYEVENVEPTIESDDEIEVEDSEEEVQEELVDDLDALIDQEIEERVEESRRILSRKAAAVKSPAKIKLSRATIEANKRAIR
jgi:hypothetical protein